MLFNIFYMFHVTYLQDSDSSLPSLIVVCGDHGMIDQGGHGGASPGEISTPIILLSSKLFTQTSKYLYNCYVP